MFLWLVAAVSAVGSAIALLVPGQEGLLLVAAPCLLASLILAARRRPARRGKGRPVRNGIIVDGSNVMHWKGGVADLQTVRAVLDELARRGFTPGVIFDANAGYKLADRYMDDAELAALLGLPEDRVLVVPRGTPADHYILMAARDMQARVVTNDRYRDWAGEFPEVAEPGFLMRGGWRGDGPWLADTVEARQVAAAG
ncbi:MAG: hypothetical protein KF887_16115 [Paracoccaceae bacterium]|nr:MAG: hypothetical protein KF887_16115 [Paracoccaceae bacterium]